MLRTLTIACTTTPTVIASSTVVANSTLAFTLAGAHIQDPVPIMVNNPSTQNIYLGGVGMTTASTALGVPLSAGNFTFSLLASDALFGITTNGTVNIQALGGRQ